MKSLYFYSLTYQTHKLALTSFGILINFKETNDVVDKESN